MNTDAAQVIMMQQQNYFFYFRVTVLFHGVERLAGSEDIIVEQGFQRLLGDFWQCIGRCEF